jgi:hypothetical protein
VARLLLLALTLPLAGCTNMRPAADSSVSEKPRTVSTASKSDAGKLDSAEVRALEQSLRGLLLKNLPDPVVKSERGWGHQKEVTLRTNFIKDGPRLISEPVKGLRNDGTWRRVAIRVANPEQSLALGITEAAFPEPGRATFTAMLGADCDLKFEQQIWKNGIRLYSGETRGRCRAAVLLKCEVVSRTETKPGSFVPDLVFRVKVTDAQLFYEKLVIEHTAGLGGDAAKLLGEVFLDTVKQARPDLERELLHKANAAIVKAADTKDIRVSFDSFLKGGDSVIRAK